jgi:DNA-binding response OmpR family regulator
MDTINKKKKILVIDDDYSFRSLLKLELEEQGYEILLAAGPSQADKILSEVTPDLITLDIKMPHVDGITYLYKIRERYSSTPIILLSAYSEFKNRFDTWACDEYLVKSSDQNELKETIRRMLVEKKTPKRKDVFEENMGLRSLLRKSEVTIDERDRHISRLIEKIDRLTKEKTEFIVQKDGQISRLEEESRRLTKENLEFLKHNVIVKPHWGIPKVQQDDNYVFVLMPYREEWSDIVWEIIRGVINEMGFQCERADDKTGKFIMNDIWNGMNQARIVIADLTSGNPNVSYEVGMSDVLGKAQIILSQNPKEVPFDFLGIRLLQYSITHGGVSKFKADLKERINRIIKDPREQKGRS